MITERGLAELRTAHVAEGVGFLSAKIDQMTFNMTFDLATRTGSVVVNVSLVDPRQLAACAEQVCDVFAKGYAMGDRVALLAPGETMGQLTVPPGRVGFCTICSITLNGVLLKHGIPTTSRFGGLLELRAGNPTRFVEVIYYDGTTIDPLEVFIRSGMTNYLGAIRTGNGLIGASFRELPGDCREVVMNLSARLTAIGLGRVAGSRVAGSARAGAGRRTRPVGGRDRGGAQSDRDSGGTGPPRRISGTGWAARLSPAVSVRGIAQGAQGAEGLSGAGTCRQQRLPVSGYA